MLPSVRLVRADVHDEARLGREFAGCDVVINLVGILNETSLGRGSGEQFRRVHTELPQKCVRAARQAGVRRYLHMSGLKADAQQGPSHYLRSKGLAEDYVREHCAAGAPEYVIFQPSVVFGPGDAFINNFAGILTADAGRAAAGLRRGEVRAGLRRRRGRRVRRLPRAARRGRPHASSCAVRTS